MSTDFIETEDPRARPTLSRRSGFWQTCIVAIVLVACGAIMILQVSRSQRPLPISGSVPADLTLKDQEGRPFPLSSLRGKVWVASFIFTHCRDTCPCITANLTALQDSVAADPRLRAGVRFASFSVDPERDSPSELKAYAQRYGADTSLWTFLTGDRGAVAKLSQEIFQLPVGPAPLKDGSGNAPEIIHSDRLTLIDALGRIRGYYRPEPEELRRLVSDLGRCLDEDGKAP